MDAINETLGNFYTQNTHTLTHLSSDKSKTELSEEEKREVDKLEKRDAEVRAHEEAHKRAAGGLAKGSPNYKYEVGPDGKRYAISGNVKIETSEGSTPDETILKAQRMKKAALAPVHPSPQDRKIAAQAQRMIEEAEKEKKAESAEDTYNDVKAAAIKVEEKNKKLLESYGDRLANDQSNYKINKEI